MAVYSCSIVSVSSFFLATNVLQTFQIKSPKKKKRSTDGRRPRGIEERSGHLERVPQRVDRLIRGRISQEQRSLGQKSITAAQLNHPIYFFIFYFIYFS
jgi:hypothetical protein